VLLRVIRVEDTANDVLIRFEVKDSGIGIAPEVQSQLFQPFTQNRGSPFTGHPRYLLEGRPFGRVVLTI
jgi:signal transduction histidine kinase